MSELTMINEAQRLYVIGHAGYVSCLGFDVAERWRIGVLQWLGEAPQAMETGTVDHYSAYLDAMRRGEAHNRATGKKCPALLTPELIGREGKRVAVIAPGEPENRFWVGRSTGWLPIHLEIKRRDSTGGGGAYVPAGAIVRTIANTR